MTKYTIYRKVTQKVIIFLYACSSASALFAQAKMNHPKLIKQWNCTDLFISETKTDIDKLGIRVDIKKAVELSVHCLTNQFDRDKQNEPYFYCHRRDDGTGEMRHAVEIGIPHVVGRSMLGCEIAHQKVGITFPSEAFDIYEYYCRQSFDNADHLNSFYKDGRRGVEMHNMREGLWSLWALIVGRDSEWAKDMAHKMLISLDNMTDNKGKWSNELTKKNYFSITGGIMADNQARMVDPLLAYYAATNDELALKLAGMYARVGLNTLYDNEGRFTPYGQSSGHIHSITSSLSGITRYAILKNDKEMIAKCVRIIEKGVPEYFSSWGWGDEVMPAHPANVISQGEINQTGDVIRTALYLGATGYTKYYELAEQYLRSMLLPSQLWEDDLNVFLRETINPKDDSEKDVLSRSLGGYGFPLPNARMRSAEYPVETQDITSGAVHALAECWEHKLVSENNQCKLNLLFDGTNDDFDIKSYLPKEGLIEFTAKTNKMLLIRMPMWVNNKSIKLSINGKDRQPVIEHGYLKVAGLATGDKGSVIFDIPCKIEEETVDGSVYKTTWIGNQIIDITPRGELSPLPF